ncbi:tetratricopeptide repeat protein 27 [Choristoneura fumiferana]|uniref:tetratricopeptide repeat protein 27 n=1 Tax=Choristoneura fumiferana TaxID=7141 RepID=UPI003D153F14
MLSDTNTLYLCNFDDKFHNLDHAVLNKLWSGKWSIDNTDLSKELLATSLEIDQLKTILKRYLEKDNTFDNILDLAISSFLTFCERNWNTHPEPLNLQDYFGTEWPSDVDATLKLQRDSEPVYVNIAHTELLYFSLQVFNALYAVELNLVHLWWYFRSLVVHQRALEDTSATLYSELELVMAKLSNEANGLQNRRLATLLHAEIAQAYLVYGRVQKVEEHLNKARELAGLKLELTGVLGKRTKWQQTTLPQLALTSSLDATVDRPSAEQSHGAAELPRDIELQDDVRLNKIQYLEEISQAELPSLEQTLCMLTVQYLQKSQPKDELMHEELSPYIEAVVSQPVGPWAPRVAALLVRCQLEAGHKRSVERAMLQCEAIVNEKKDVAPTTRLSYLWASGVGPAWCWRQQLAALYLSLGLVKAALEHYQRLMLWEDVILCYTMLQLRHKAAEIIQQQIDINPTVKLYCLLGDATDDVSCYEKAWEFSEHASSRAQRHWGNFLFDRKQYAECIPHFERSLEINSIQETIWLRLGYAALETGQWETSGRAYRRYTYLQPNTFEAWNNLAKVYVQQADKPRAHRALMEALRYNYDNWKLWENVIIVSMDTGHFEDAIRGAHRLLDIRHQFRDAAVLALLVRAVLHDKEDADGNTSARLQKRVLELFGRITSVHQNVPEIWQLYSDLSPSYLLKAQRLLKAYRGYTQSGNWPNSPETCQKVIDLAQNLLEYSLQARQEAEDKDKAQADQQLSSARLTGQAVLRAAEKQAWPENKDALERLTEMFNKVTEYMKSVM